MAVGTLDFVSTPPDVSPGACHSKTSGPNKDVVEKLLHIRAAISDNIIVLVVCAFVVACSVGIVVYCYSTLSGMFTEWRAHQLSNGKAEKLVESARDPDDAVYRSTNGYDDLPQSTEADAIAARMKSVVGLYGPYNQAMRARAANRGELPDDLMDANILRRTDDDFRYPRRKKDALRFRPGAGAQRVYASFAEGDIGLRDPVYKTS
jgi:hypothetical protein